TGPGRVFNASFPTAETDGRLGARDERSGRAAASSIRALLAPRSVAVVGASRRPGSIGAALAHSLRAVGFAAPIYPVNPEATEVEGLRSYARLSDITAPVDLAVIAVP